MKKRAQRLAFLIVFVAGCLPAAFAASARIVNLVEMVEAADRVFRGHCISVTPAGSLAGLQILEYVFEADEGYKGVASGQRVVFRQVQGAGRGNRGISGLPGFDKGQEVVLFLYPDSQLGLTSPVGLTQGNFQVIREEGRIVMLNGVSNRNLMEGLSAAEVQEVGLSRAEVESFRKSGSVSLDLMRSAVHRIEDLRLRKAKSIR